MSSIRKFKKQVRYACGDLAAETLVASYYINGFAREDAHRIICDVAALQTDTISKCKFYFDKTRRDFGNEAEYRKARRAYFKAAFGKLRENFRASMENIVKEMNKALPTEAKEANKAQ
ncbi:MAG: hypothetical protein K2L80_09345 [Muribaculaceae bacterium]|nr:hypothetical protein [Muribaculaceae bacterium]MDE6332794.1 hypothetical protein [Muribaculaceae bacterium]